MIYILSSYFSRHSWLAAAWTIGILIVCNMPSSDVPTVTIPGLDKVVHICLFYGFAFLWLHRFPKKNRTIFWTAVAFGICIEFLQYLLPYNRSFEWEDILADSLGALLALISYQPILKLFGLTSK